MSSGLAHPHVSTEILEAPVKAASWGPVARFVAAPRACSVRAIAMIGTIENMKILQYGLRAGLLVNGFARADNGRRFLIHPCDCDGFARFGWLAVKTVAGQPAVELEGASPFGTPGAFLTSEVA